MYTKAEASFIKEKFWTSFVKYMSPVPSASNEKVNWVNYKTGIKGILFKLNSNEHSASVSVEISLNDKMLQHQYFDTFNNFVIQFKGLAGNDWLFMKNSYVENKGEVSAIVMEIQNVNIFKQDDWPTIISFLKKYVIGLDAFWADYKPAFELI